MVIEPTGEQCNCDGDQFVQAKKLQCTANEACPIEDHVYRQSWGECERVDG